MRSYRLPLLGLFLFIVLSLPMAASAQSTIFDPIIPEACKCASVPVVSADGLTQTGAMSPSAPGWGCVLTVVQNIINTAVEAEFGQGNGDQVCGAYLGRSRYLDDLIDKTPPAEISAADLVAVSLAELGFNDGFGSCEASNYNQVCARAREFGLELCPAEVGPQLWLQTVTMAEGEFLRIAMEPVVERGGHRLIYTVSEDSGRPQLGWTTPDDTRTFFSNDKARFVFVLPRE